MTRTVAIVDGWFKETGIEAPVPSKSKMYDKLTNDVMVIGIMAASAFTVIEGVEFLVKNHAAIEKMISGASFAVEHWDEITLAWDVIEFVGVGNILDGGAELAGMIWEHGDLLVDAVDALGIGADLADAATTFGLSIALSVGVHYTVKHFNGDKEEHLKMLRGQIKKVNKVKVMLERALPAAILHSHLAELPEHHWKG